MFYNITYLSIIKLKKNNILFYKKYFILYIPTHNVLFKV
jgi:hypothetical protein